MRLREMLSAPTNMTFGPHCKVRDCDLRAWHILQYAKRLLALGMPPPEVLETVEDLEALGTEEETREEQKNGESVSALRASSAVVARPQDAGTSLLTIAQASRKYDVSQDSFRSRVKKGTLRAYRTDPIMVLEKDVMEAVKNIRTCPARRKKRHAAETSRAVSVPETSRGEAELITIGEATRMFSVSRTFIEDRIGDGRLRIYGTAPRRVGKEDVAEAVKSGGKRPRPRKKGRARKGESHSAEGAGRLLTISEACKKFGITDFTLYKKIQSGKLKSVGFRPRKVREKDVAGLLKNMRRRPLRKKAKKHGGTRAEKEKEAEALRKGPLTPEENRKRLEALRLREEKRQDEWREPVVEV